MGRRDRARRCSRKRNGVRVSFVISPDQTRLTLHEQTETKWTLINLTARIGGRRLLMRNHESAMRRGELGMKQAIARGYKPPDLDATVT